MSNSIVRSEWNRFSSADPDRICRARNLYMSLLFNHPLSTYSQSIDHLWLDTSYTLIMAYREAISRLESTDKQQLRKALTRFRQALSSEDTFYRTLLTRLIAYYQLQPLVREIPVATTSAGPEHATLTSEQKETKIGLIYKVLICQGDLERYKEQYGEKREYKKAKSFYELARRLQPDQGELSTVNNNEPDLLK